MSQIICWASEFRIQKQAFTHYCHLHGPSLAQQINCDKIFVVLLFCVILLLLIFTKIMLLLLFYFIIFFFFMKVIFIFSCSGMFRHVRERSVFRVLSTPHFCFSLQPCLDCSNSVFFFFFSLLSFFNSS